MKKLYTLLFLVVASVSFGQTFYSENMGTPTATTPIASNVFQNTAPIVYSGTGDVRSTSVSSGYTGASGGGNVFINAAGEYFQIDGLNTSTYNTADIQLSFGYNAGGSLSNLITIEHSVNGTDWTAIAFTPGGTAWSLVTITGGQIPSSATLSLRFTQPAATLIRLDDVKLSIVSASCTLILGTPTTACDASTLGTDTYTVTIPFTGGGNAAYLVTPSSGIVGGDSATSNAVGNITVSGVAEGVSFSATVVGGTCNFTTNANSPECKPINTLPYNEAFPYAVGASLGAQQKWTNVNSGDNIVSIASSLSYPNFTSSGNSVSFSGAGAESFTPFTTTATGTVYSSFMINVTDMVNVTTDLTETYFAGLTNALKEYNARLFIKKNGTQYQLGFDSASTTTNYDATLRNVGEVVFVVMGYDFGTNTLNAWFNPNLTSFNASTPASLTNTPATAFTDFGGFILRQDGSSNTPSITFDELRISETTTGLLSIAQNSITGLKIYPNPVSNGKLFIETAANSERTVAIFDILGKQVVNTTSSQNEINVSKLNAGVYIVKITEEGKTATRKLVIK
jgi:hypothetical protein